MKKTIRRIIAAVLMLSVALGVTLIPAAGESKADEFFSVVDSYTAKQGTFTLTENSRLYVLSEDRPSDDLLETATLIRKQLQTHSVFGDNSVVGFVWGPENCIRNGDIVLKLDSSAAVGDEGYLLDIDDTVTVSAKDLRGLIYGTNMLQKYFRYSASSEINKASVSDTPDTKQRAVMLDTGRKYYTAEWIKNFIRQLSWMGYNAIELHFSEDGGFRADFWDSAYYTENYSPENDFSWLCGSHIQSWVKDPYRTDPDAGKYLTTGELVEILQVAKEYHIDVIPSFDSPAHMDYITWKFEQNYKANSSYSFTYDGITYKASSTKGCINYTGKTGASTPTWPYYTTIDITDGTMAKAFVFALYEDIADFFKEYAGSTDFSIGADEVNLSSSYSPKWSYSAFPGYVNELNRMLNKKGYTCRMFNDFIGSTTYNISGGKAKYTFDSNIEIMYWNSDFDPTAGTWDEPVWHVKFFWENNTGSTDNWGDGGRTMYNCIQTNTYYVLRVAADGIATYGGMDARNPENRNWTFYHSTEDLIYNEWYPADISEKGVYAEDAADVPDEQLGGAYFLIWNDYAALNTEKEVWEGVDDKTSNKGTETYFYSLFDRMWSNTIKMWNSDINSTVDYSRYAAVRSTYGYFPLYKGCSAPAEDMSLNSITRAYLADHTELNEALKNKISNDELLYTDESFAAYEEAYASAKALFGKYEATQTEIDNAVNALKAAKAKLEERIIIDKSALQKEVDAAITEQGNYTDSTWTTYQLALKDAEAVLNDENASQETVDNALATLIKAKNDLYVYIEGEAEIISVRRISEITPLGKKAGLVIITSTDAENVTLELDGVNIELTNKVHNTQILSGEECGVWMVDFVPEETGTFTYTVVVNGTVKKDIDITIK
ncbi:MAG: family 20 glycosylhydrolase [Clostridia bacterium]|nr:family 20 glycosylhydrolase [Clostridia bacterium]